MDCRWKKKEMKVNTYTRDVQQANITIIVNYRLEPSNAHVTYKDVGRQWDDIIVPQAIEGELKKVIGQYDAVDLISHRAKATDESRMAVASNLKKRDVLLASLEMVNIQYLKEFEKSVEDKVIATQKAVEEQNRTKQVQEQAKQKVIAAEAEARAIQIRAQALQSNPKLVDYEAVHKWDGHLPQYIFGNAVPFINMERK